MMDGMDDRLSGAVQMVPASESPAYWSVGKTPTGGKTMAALWENPGQGSGKTGISLGNAWASSDKRTPPSGPIIPPSAGLMQEIADTLPPNFGFDADRQVIFSASGEGEMQDICGPIARRRTVTDETESNWLCEFAFLDRRGGLQTLVLPEADIHSGAALVRAFAERGLAIHGSPSAFRDLIKAWEPSGDAIRLSRRGWAPAPLAAYLRPDGSVLGADPEDAARRFVGTIAPTDFAVEAANAVTALHPLVRGNSMAITGVCLGLAGPVLGLTDAPGFGVHLAGPSGIGKSTIARLAQAVWSAEPMRSGEATGTALLAMLALSQHGLIAIDELRPKAGMAEVVYSIGNGAGRDRTNGAGALRDSVQTQGITLTTGEISVAEAIAATGDQVHDGQMVRHLTVPLAGFPHGLFDQLNGFAVFEDLAAALSAAGARHAGQLSARFITCLCKDRAAMADRIAALIAECHADLIARLITPGWPVDGKARRALRNFALLLATGKLAEDFGLACWEDGELVPAITEAARRALLFLRKPDLFSDAEGAKAERDVRSRILIHVDRDRAAIHVKGSAPPARPIIGWLDDAALHLPPATLEAIFGTPGAAKAATDTLRMSGHLILCDGRHIGRKLPTWTGHTGRALSIRRASIGL